MQTDQNGNGAGKQGNLIGSNAFLIQSLNNGAQQVLEFWFQGVDAHDYAI